MHPCIMHVDIDAFFASVEQARDPRLRGRPVIVGSGVIASCSYEAREYGLCAGMPLNQARRLCPAAVILEGHYPTYRCFSRRVFELCREVAPHVEAHLDEAYCDLTGTDALHGGPEPAGRRLKDTVKAETGLTVSVGIGTNRMIARMAGSSGKPDGLVRVPEDREADFVRDLPVRELPAVGRARLEVLRQLNIATIGDLRAVDRSDLEALFGADGAALYERCRGRDSRGIAEDEQPKSISRETAFEQDTADRARIDGMLYYLVERAARAVRDLGLQCRTIGVRIRYADSKGDAATRSLPGPSDLDSELFAVAHDLLDRLYRRRVSLHALGVRFSRLSMSRERQGTLFGGTDPARRARLYNCLDRLRGRFGHTAVVTGKVLDTLGEQREDHHGFILRTPCLTK
ncbi:MAG: DNA polymerase IV [Planctomycetota bacterium]